MLVIKITYEKIKIALDYSKVSASQHVNNIIITLKNGVCRLRRHWLEIYQK